MASEFEDLEGRERLSVEEVVVDPRFLEKIQNKCSVKLCHHFSHTDVLHQKYRDAVQKDQIKRQTMEMKLQEDFGANIKEMFQLNRAEIETPTIADHYGTEE
jgi:hypothetical protein